MTPWTYISATASVSTNLLGNQGEDATFPVMVSCLGGACIAATLNAWARTHLWEFLLSLALQIVMLGYLQTVRMVDSRPTSFLIGIAVVSSCVETVPATKSG
jgi:hypothetical protein